MFCNKLVALVAALLAQEAVARNAHRHAHGQYHAKKDVVYADDVVTITDWTVVTVYEDGTTVHTTAPKAIYKGAAHSEHYSSASSSKTTTTTTTSSSSSSSSSSTSLRTSTLTVTPTIVPSPTTFATVVKVSSSPVSSSTPVPAVAAANVNTQAHVEAQANAPAAAAAAAATTSVAAAVAIATTSTTAAPAATTVSSSSSSSGGGKRGLAYNSGSLLSPFLGSGSKCSWSYNWGQVADASAPSNIEFVPMLWGPTHADGWSSSAESAIANGATNFLSFNECDNAGQCNLDPASAAAAHIKYMNPYSGRVRIGAPAITNSNNAGEGVSWLTSFVSACGGQCAFDFCAAHWYNNADTDDFLNHLVSVHEACGKPVWITEFAPFGSDDEINTFLTTVLNELDNNAKYSFVERYSYFMAATGSLLTSSSSLSTYGNTYAFN